MPSGFRTKLLASVSAAALVVLVGLNDGKAQTAAAKPYGVDLFIQGGWAFNSGSDTPFAQLTPPFGNGTLNVSSGDGWNGKIGGALHFMNVWNAQLTYTGLRASATSSTRGFIAPGNAYPLFSVLAGGYSPLPGSGTSWNRAVAKSTTRADIIDFQAGFDIGLGGGVSSTLFAGLRFGSFNQQTNVTFFDIAGAPQSTDSRQSRFQGLGPTLGMKASMPLPAPVSGFGIEGSVLGGVLFGEVKSRTTGSFVNPNPFSLLPRNITKDSVSPNVDAELALTYTVPTSGATLQVAAGYQLNYYGGVRDSANGSSTPPIGQRFGSTTDDLLYHGPFLRLKASF